jgi:hypothetical protein
MPKKRRGFFISNLLDSKGKICGPGEIVYDKEIDDYYKKRGTVCIVTHIPATCPRQEYTDDGTGYREALRMTRVGRIRRKVL